MNYKHSQFNAGWWACLCSVANVDLRITKGMSAMLKEVLREAGVSRDEAEYVLDYNIVEAPMLREYIKWLER